MPEGVHVISGEINRVQDRPSENTVYAQIQFDTSDVPDEIPVADWLEQSEPEIDLRVQTETEDGSDE